MKLCMKTTLIALLGMASICMAQTADESLNATLERHYKDQVLILRHPQLTNSQVYDDSGSPTTTGAEGPWTIYGGVKVKKMSVSPSELRIVGERVGFKYAFEQTGRIPVSLKEKKPITIQVRLAKPPVSVEEIDLVIQHVFAANDQALIESVPDFWRSCLERRLKEASGEVKPAAAHEQEELDKKVSPPKAIHTPEPAYNKIAKRLNLEGTVVLDAVVGIDGLVHRVQIVQPVGLGLDEEAVAIVKKWRFKPGELDGRLVPVEMSLEIGFKLY